MPQPPKPHLIPPSLIEKVLSQAQTTASHSWEYGVVFEALLEYHDPSATVFNTPIPQHKPHLSHPESEVKALDYISPFVRTTTTTLCDGNGSSADPASLGIPAVLLHAANPSAGYLAAARRQIEHLLTAVPRLPNGATSHREVAASAWADFVYMVPPFLAYYGVYTDEEEMVREAVRQCCLYCELLGTECGSWMHVVSVGDRVSGECGEDDRGLWSTSNGWATAGMARVLATVRGSRFAGQMRREQKWLVKMIEGVVCGAMSFDTDASGLLRNYLDDETWWGEVSGTALLAATVFRMAVLEPDVFGSKHTDWALQKMETVRKCISTETGVASLTVNPLKESQRTPLEGVSPEGQAFVVLMYAAWRDWTQKDLLSP